MKIAVVALILFALLAATGWQMRPASAEVPPDYDIPNGHFYTQTNGAPASLEPTGYAVSNEGGVLLWDEYRRLGGVGGLGYPVSRRFTWDGFTVQAFQKGVLQWQADAGKASLINIFDVLHNAGKDQWLQDFRATPPPRPAEADAGKPWEVVQRERLDLLNANQAIKNQYFSIADPLTYYGLPVSAVVDNGNHFVVRLQRAVIQQWKMDVPWAKAGQVTVANGGDIAKDAGLFPSDAVALELPPWGAGRVVAIDAGHGGKEVGAAYRFSDGSQLAEKDLNLRVALKVADLLARAGYKPVLTRRTDTEVNKPLQLLTRRLPIGLDDELQARVDLVNRSGAKLFLSIHFNGHPNGGLSGSEVYYCKERPFAVQSKRFADLLLVNLVRGLATIGYQDQDPSVKDDSQAVGKGQHFYLLGPVGNIIVRPSEMPAALAEGLFVTNSLDAANLRVERTLDVIARSYATAIHQYFVGNDTAQFPVPTPPAGATPSATPSPSPSPVPSATPSPAITPQPTPTPAGVTGKIATEFGGGAMMRGEPATAAPVVRAIPNGGSVNVLQGVNGEAVVAGDPLWYRILYDDDEGYVYGQLVRMPAGSKVPTPTPTPIGKGTIVTDAGVGAVLRAKPATSAEAVRALPNGAVIDLMQAVNGEAVISGDARWYAARYDGSEGYVYGQLVQTGGGRRPVPTPTPAAKGTIVTDAGVGAVLRAKPATSAEAVRALPNGAMIDLIQMVNGEALVAGDARWYAARYDGSEGYVYGQLVQLDGGRAPPPAPIGKGTVATETGGGAMLRAKPATSAEVVATIPNGTLLDLLQLVNGEAVIGGDARWYHARHGGDEGYIYAGLILRQ